MITHKTTGAIIKEKGLYKNISFTSKVGYMTKHDVLLQIECLLENIMLTKEVYEEVEDKLNKKVKKLNSTSRSYYDLCKIRQVLENEYVDQLEEVTELKEAKKEEVETVVYGQIEELSKLIADMFKKTSYKDIRVDFYNIVIYHPRTIKYIMNEEINTFDLLDENARLPKVIFDKIIDFYDARHRTYFEEGEVIKFTDSQEIYKVFYGKITDNADYNNLTVRSFYCDGDRLIDMGYKDISVEYNRVTKVTDNENIRIINTLIDDLKFDDNNNVIIMPDNTVDISVHGKVNYNINVIDNTDIEQSDDFRVIDHNGIEYTIDISMTKTDIISVLKEQILNRLLNYGTYSVLSENEEIASVEIKKVS